MSKFRPGDRVSLCTKDFVGYQWYNCIVEKERKDGRVDVVTDPGRVSLLLHRDELVLVRVIWQDTRKPVRGEDREIL